MTDVRTLIHTAETWPAPAGDPSLPDYEDGEDPGASTALGWTIRDRGTLDWAVKRCGECEAEVEAIEAQKAAAIERIEKRAAALIDRTRRGVAFFKSKILEYAEAHRVELCPGKKKSVDLLHGRVGFRSKGGRLATDNKDALLAWLERQPPESGLYRVEIKPDMKAIQDHFQRTNEVPPGMHYELPEETIYVEPVLPEGPALKEKA